MRLSVFFFCFFFCVFLIRFPSHSMNSGILSGTFHLLRFKLMQAGTQFAMESCLRLGFAREWGLVSLWDPIDQSRRLFARRTLWGRSLLLLCTGSVLLWRGEKCWDSAPNDLGSSLLEMQQQISQSWPETEDFQLGQPSSVPDQSETQKCDVEASFIVPTMPLDVEITVWKTVKVGWFWNQWETHYSGVAEEILPSAGEASQICNKLIIKPVNDGMSGPLWIEQTKYISARKFWTYPSFKSQKFDSKFSSYFVKISGINLKICVFFWQKIILYTTTLIRSCTVSN